MAAELSKEDEKILKSFPVFSKEDLQRVNALFKHYIFYTTGPDGDRKCQCTRCGKSFSFQKHARTQTPEYREFMQQSHGGAARCPECGHVGDLKNTARYKSGNSLDEWRRCILLHVKNGAVYAQAYYVRKQYGPGYWNPAVEYCDKGLYVFKQGEAIGWRYQNDGTGRWIYERMKNIGEPWSSIGYGGWSCYFCNGYHLIGTERLAGTHLEYAFREYLAIIKGVQEDREEHDYAMRFMDAASRNGHIEMLSKMGLRQMVNDLVVGKKKIREVNWSEKNPCKAFGLSKQELREFIAINGSGRELRWHRKFKESGNPVSFLELDKAKRSVPGHELEDFLKACTTGCGVKPEKALRYLQSQADKQKISRNGALIQWKDYVEAAKFCGFDLSTQIALMPKKLKEAHDGAVETEAQMRHEAELASDSDYQKRYNSLMKRYGFENDEFFIRAPSSSREIVEEGKVLNHCVGRYAGKHAAGRTTILFMRRKREPFTPAWTIEMRGETMVQIQGKGNEYGCKPKGKEKEFVDQWLGWVSEGSKRDKNGNPILPEKKDKEVKTA